MIKIILVIGSVTSKHYAPLRMKINLLGGDRAQVRRMSFTEFEELINAGRFQEIFRSVSYFVMDEEAYEYFEDRGTEIPDGLIDPLDGGYVTRTGELGSLWLDEIAHDRLLRRDYPSL